MRPEIKSFHRKQLPAFSLLLLSLMLFGLTSAQRVAPGVPPQHYQQVPVQHNQQPQYQQQQQQQIHHAPNVNPQQYQQQVQYQQAPVQQQQQQQYQQQQQQPQYQQQAQPQQQQQFQQPPPQQVQQHAQHAPHGHHGQQQVLNAANIQDERAHIQEHMQVPIDTSKMSEAELQFHYFKMHDSDNNNKLDGCELIKSLIHWHVQGSHDKKDEHHGTDEEKGKIYSDESLTDIIDYVLKQMDLNNDGYVDYAEYRKSEEAQMSDDHKKP
ncbi:involucrin isoform X2 [Zeugodacus cucurbitae]|nr:involucrin isoform X2 [Zeugodacus cucurbitae]